MHKKIDRRGFIVASSAAALASWLSRSFAQRSVPRAPFGPDATAEEVTAGLDLTGRTAVVTGCNSGIGYETMRVLALRGAHVIGTARTIEKGEEACASVVGRATPVVLELTDFDSIVACTDRINAMGIDIDMLICNAGVLYNELRQVRGLEEHFVVNHLGHFIFTSNLLARVIAAPQGRVVVVGSTSHRQVPPGGIQFDDLSGASWGGNYYGHSKLANGLFSLELSKRLAGTSATSNALHPGVVATNIFRNMGVRPGGGGGGARRGGFSMDTPAMGAANQCYVAAHPLVAGVTGQYFVDFNPAPQSEHQTDARMAARLWEVSEALTRDYLT